MELNIALAIVGGLVLLLSLSAGFVKSTVYPVSEPMAAVLVGLLVGPLVFDLLALEHWGDPKKILQEVARLTIAVSVMGIALRLPKRYFRKHLRSMLAILVPGLLMMWLVSGLLVYGLLGVSFWLALLIGAVVTPTDPVLGGTVVTGETAEQNIAGRLRHFLSCEAGANDGGALPFVLLAIMMLKHPAGEALSEWLVHTVLWDVGAAVVVGLLIGYGAGRLQRWSEQKDYMEKTSLLTVTLALSFTVLGVVKLMGSDGILAVFAAGLAFDDVTTQQREAEETSVQESIKRLFTYPVFVLFGMHLPWEQWLELGGVGVLLAGLILLLRRLPMMFALQPLLRPLRQRADVLFTGWFGPIGIAALYYAMLAVHETGREQVWVMSSLIITASIVVHGVTATPLTLWYGRPEQSAAE